MDLSPKGIIEKLGLRKPIYEKTASYGHFGRTPEIDGGFSWEKTDLIDLLSKTSLIRESFVRLNNYSTLG